MAAVAERGRLEPNIFATAVRRFDLAFDLR